MAENYFGLTDTGRARTNNEDAFIAQRIPDSSLIMVCVIDGVGGYEGGEVAAAIAKETLLEAFNTNPADVVIQMRQAFEMANEKIKAAKVKGGGNDSMACVLTLAIVDIDKNQFYYAHVGDTRLYLFRDASLVKVSKDHSFVGFLEDTGRLSEEAAMQHPKRNEINKALGFGGTITGNEEYIETGESPFLPGDMLLLCSDGLTDMINKAEITALLSAQNSLEEKAMQMVAAANDKGGKDNITVALVHNDKKPVQQKATKPPVVKKNEIPKAEIEDSAVTIAPPASPNRNRKNKTVVALSVLCLLLLAALSWSLWKWLGSNKPDNRSAVSIIHNKNNGEIKLQQIINHSVSDTVFLTDSMFAQPLMLSDTIEINRPYIYLKGTGNIIINADSAFKGPAFLITAGNSKVVLDSLLFENFDIAIASYHRNITLKNTRFNQCRVAVATYMSFPEILYVNGTLKDTAFATDSIPKSGK